LSEQLELWPPRSRTRPPCGVCGTGFQPRRKGRAPSLLVPHIAEIGRPHPTAGAGQPSPVDSGKPGEIITPSGLAAPLRRRSVGAGRRTAMCVHGPGDEDEEYDYDDYYEPGMDQEQDDTGLTIRSVYGYESADYLDHLFSERCPPETPPQPRKPA